MVATIAPESPVQGSRRELADRLATLLSGARQETIERLAATARLRALRAGDVIYPQAAVP